jgi:hypothetical protein
LTLSKPLKAKDPAGAPGAIAGEVVPSVVYLDPNCCAFALIVKVSNRVIKIEQLDKNGGLFIRISFEEEQIMLPDESKDCEPPAAVAGFSPGRAIET